MMGRPPKPTALKLLAGNPGKHPLNDREPMPEVGVPDPLGSLTAEAKVHYERLVSQLVAVKVLTVVDGPALSGLAQAIADYEEATKELEKGGKVIKGDKGLAVKSPWFLIQKQALDQMQRGYSDFGLTPVARVRIKHNGKKETGDESEALFG